MNDQDQKSKTSDVGEVVFMTPRPRQNWQGQGEAVKEQVEARQRQRLIT